MRIHNRNNLIHKGNTFYQDCKCFYCKNPVGVTKTAGDNSGGFFCLYHTTWSEPFHFTEVQHIAGEVPARGEDEGVAFEFPGDAVQEGEAGIAVVSRTAVQGHRALGVVLEVPAAAMDLDIAPDQVAVLVHHSIDEGSHEGRRGIGNEDEFRM